MKRVKLAVRFFFDTIVGKWLAWGIICGLIVSAISAFLYGVYLVSPILISAPSIVIQNWHKIGTEPIPMDTTIGKAISAFLTEILVAIILVITGIYHLYKWSHTDA